MNAVVIEHVALDELPDAWRAQLHTVGNARVTVRIEEEPAQGEGIAFGMWRDREDVFGHADCLRRLQKSRCFDINENIEPRCNGVEEGG